MRYPTPARNFVTSQGLSSRIAVFGTAIALVAATALVSASAANAAGAFAVTTPSDNATAVQQSLPNVVDFAGTGLPTADTATVSYLDGGGTVRNATFASSQNDGAGNWTGGENFAQLSVGQTHVVAVVIAVNSTTLVVDAAVPPVSVTFDLAVAPNPAAPFVIDQPVTNSTTPVANITPIFSGTGAAGDTVTITYGARAGAVGTAATTVVAADGTWTTATDFSLLEPGSTDGSAIVTETGANGIVVPGTSAQRINFTFPAAPAPAIPLTLTTDPASTTITEVSTVGVAFLSTGFSPDEEVTIAVTDPSGSVVALPQLTPHIFADDLTGSLIGLVLLPATATVGTYAVTVTGVRTARVATGAFTVAADPVVTDPVVTDTSGDDLPVVSG